MTPSSQVRQFVFACTCLALFACESMRTPPTDTEILDSYKAYNQRVDRVLAPLLKANTDLCPKTKPDSGARLHRLADYPKRLRPTAKTLFMARDTPSVFYTLPDSPAAKAGLKPGDEVDEAHLNTIGKENIICAYGFKIRFEQDANAYADGANIIVTSGLLRAIDDETLSLVLAHELAHNVRAHAGKPLKDEFEREADRYALYFLARAGLDYQNVAHLHAATHQPHQGRAQLSPSRKNRQAYFKTIIKEIDALITKGRPLNPTKP
ncbi:MAG TPA: hypothetical protein ENJ42_06950 [Hellea balneolensis]|uniref:Peptidase M48 domain-containing protein n=1 Tax=Hellea balneolensis TaxID=287478 RepID=A0A7C5LTV2_9PROT|nr:hypothetical protein [Hellea balneolensis]